MGDNKISEAAVEAGRHAYWHHPDDGGDDRKAMRAALEAAFAHLQGEAVPVAQAEAFTVSYYSPMNFGGFMVQFQSPAPIQPGTKVYLHPQPAELSEQRGVALRYLTQRELDSIGSQAEGMDGEQWDRWVQAKFAEVNGLATVDSDGFIALAATGKQQVGEVQGDALLESLVARWRKDAEEAGTSDNTLCQKIANCTMRHAAELQAVIAARQPVGQEPVAFVSVDELRVLKEGRSYPWMPTVFSRPNGPQTEPIYAAPPAQGIDLTPIATRKLADLAAQGYVTNGVAIFNPATGQRGLVDNLGYVGWQGAHGPDGNMFWLAVDGERMGYSVEELIDDMCDGEEVEIQTALQLPNFWVRVKAGDSGSVDFDVIDGRDAGTGVK